MITERMILTTRGVKPIRSVLIGDKVFEYPTGDELEIVDIVNLKWKNKLIVRYTDGREELYTDPEMIYKYESEQFPLQPVRFNEGKVESPLYPDPYVAGALLIFGDLEDPYMNFPIDRIEIIANLFYKYMIEYFPQTKNGKTYFKFSGKDSDEKITWNEFFRGKDRSNVIPDEYVYTTINGRMQFIRGVFDTGYEKDRSPDSVGITHNNLEQLKAVQRVLWSLGFPAIVLREDKYPHKPYKLAVIGKGEYYPGFFYSMDYLTHMINTDYDVTKLNPEFSLSIDSCNIINNVCQPNTEPHIILSKRNALYVSPNFLPRVSI